MFRRLSLCALAVGLLFAAPVQAATTVFADTVDSQTNVANASGALGAADSATATVGSVFFGIFGIAGSLTLQFSEAVTGAGITLSTLNSALASNATIEIGEIVSGTTVFSAPVAFTETGGGLFTFDLSSQCGTISATGCSFLRISTSGGLFAGALALDGVSGVSAAPEPTTWLMMIVGFAFVAWRLKALRRASFTGSRAGLRAAAPVFAK